MSIPAITESEIDQLVKFRSKNDRDPTVYLGRVEGRVNYRAAMGYGDLVSYHAAVLRNDPDVPNVDTLSFFIITLDGENNGAVRVFANEWIAEGTLQLVDQRVVYTVEVFDLPDRDPSALLAHLESGNYRARIIATRG